MREAYDMQFCASVMTSTLTHHLLIKLLEDVHTKYNYFKTESEFGRLYSNLIKKSLWMPYFLDLEKTKETIKHDHIFLPLLNMTLLCVSRIRLCCLDGQKRHTMFNLCIGNQILPSGQNQSIKRSCIDSTEKKSHLNQLSVWLDKHAYTLITHRCFENDLGFDVLGRKAFPLYRRKSFWVIKGHEAHHSLTFQNWLGDWLESLDSTANEVPRKNETDRINPKATCYSPELYEMKKSIWDKIDKVDFCYHHINNLRAMAMKSILTENSIKFITELHPKSQYKEYFDYENESKLEKQILFICGNGKPSALQALSSFTQKKEIMSIVLFMTSMFYNERTLDNFKKLIDVNGQGTQSLHNELLNNMAKLNDVPNHVSWKVNVKQSIWKRGN